MYNKVYYIYINKKILIYSNDKIRCFYIYKNIGTTSGTTYYGETALYFLAISGNYNCRVELGNYLMI